MSLRKLASAAALGLLFSVNAVADWHGPEPTAQSIVKNGPYTVKTVKISNTKTPGFGAATLYIPQGDGNGSDGSTPPAFAPTERFGGIVTIPGYFEPQAAMSFFGPRYASHGFVVLTIDVNALWDYPAARAKAAKAALDYLVNSSEARDLIDPERLALIGHSMGGGAALLVAESVPVKAVLAMQPWVQRAHPNVTAATLVVAGSLDNIAPPTSHAYPTYQGLSGAQQKAYLNLMTGTHWASITQEPLIQGRALAWLKTQLDDDSRYQPFVCEKAKLGTSYVSTACTNN